MTRAEYDTDSYGTRGARMWEPGQQLTPTVAMTAVTVGLTALASADMTALKPDEHAELVRGLGAAEAQVVAARSAVLAAFEANGTGSPQSWLRWQTRITPAASSSAAAWMRRLRAHPDVAAALAAGEISPSWARQVCDWTGVLPFFDQQYDADKVLLAAASGGAELTELASLAEQIIRRVRGPRRLPRRPRLPGPQRAPRPAATATPKETRPPQPAFRLRRLTSSVLRRRPAQ